MMQGFGVGAELGGAYVMSTEAAQEHKRGFYGSLPGAGEFIGVVMASGAVAAVPTLPEDDLLSRGWRIPFLASARGGADSWRADALVGGLIALPFAIGRDSRASCCSICTPVAQGLLTFFAATAACQWRGRR
ncbi:hypothetical protein E5082_21855 [Streptomyces griseoluteus]|uniref:Major facilitator superfamily (MFS) profile domain-containing protein n=1 Tax=Streptomyces griseoluteus TaxID=29306 RepID=A0A4Z1DDB7_STRGP|nr:MHS family MFS transporter [Streptomyces griseoluteus]TGN80060.1 hypothetical protein E5082_21855 [Streptomyces griseoluteus]